MDRNRNEDITPEDTELAGVGGERPRSVEPEKPVKEGEIRIDPAKGRSGVPYDDPNSMAEPR